METLHRPGLINQTLAVDLSNSNSVSNGQVVVVGIMMEELTCEPCAFVVVLKNDGSEGGRYPLLEDTIIGR